MEKSLMECLNGQHGSYILPFLWLHGEPKERIKEEILAIKKSGILEFCAESRVHEGFCHDSWWDDFAFILKTAKEEGMRVWLLDDRSFPTGYANGYFEKSEHAHLRKRLIRERQTEVLGPMKSAKIWVQGWLENKEEKIISVIAYRYRGQEERLDYESAVDLTSNIKDGMVCWDVPKGEWRVCVTILCGMQDQYDKRMEYYIDMLNPESCRAMLEAVYEPHYEHFKEYFGNTFAGFFSDEPGFLNKLYTYQNTLGIMNERYPWRDDLPLLIANSAGMSENEVRLAIPSLWEDMGEINSAIRTHYMEVVTKLYRENFSYMLGDWCRAHGVMYIGHVIEDGGAHMRLGYGSGHYFRALDGQDMAGIDVVLIQDIPGIADFIHRAPVADGGAIDPAFFRYTMPKLAASHSHIQPLKKGRAMCEIFGAFGWAEGLPYMKGLADIMLASGINHFVPHAFSPKEEDKDCPPHFYNGGKNIQYPLFKNLMEYMGRSSHMISGGKHKADVAVFYNAEGEWTGGKNQAFQTICRELTTNLIDFDIVPIDVLQNAEVRDKRLLINGEDFGALIVSESEIMPLDRLECFNNLAKKGLPVIFTESLPLCCAEGKDIRGLIGSLKVVSTSKLAEQLRKDGLCHVSGEGEGLSHLRFYHITRDNKDIYLFSNEAIRENVNAYITLPQKGECIAYDPWENRCYVTSTKEKGLVLHIEKGNMMFFIFGDEIPKALPPLCHETQRRSLSLDFDIFVRDENEKEFSLLAEKSPLADIFAYDGMSRFSGEVLYKAAFTAYDGYTVLDLGEVGETAEVWLNGEYVGARINAPYKFDLSKVMRPGENELKIIVKSNLAYRRRDGFSCFVQIPPIGIVGEISLCKHEPI